MSNICIEIIGDIIYNIVVNTLTGGIALLKVLCVGDVCGSIGCSFFSRVIPSFKRKEGIDLCIVNGENSADGNGITVSSAESLFNSGADIITGGNHTLRRKEVYGILETNPYLLCPDNLPDNPGSGYCLYDMGRVRIAVLNISGTVYLNKDGISSPFDTADALINRAKEDSVNIIILDFHAEATSEKRALGIYLDGRISALFGTHTHIQTADASVLKNGTGYITDLGMTGPEDSVLGVESDIIIARFRKTDCTGKFRLATGKCILTGCIFEIDEKTGRTEKATPVYIKENEI